MEQTECSETLVSNYRRQWITQKKAYDKTSLAPVGEWNRDFAEVQPGVCGHYTNWDIAIHIPEVMVKKGNAVTAQKAAWSPLVCDSHYTVWAASEYCRWGSAR
jgi:hypothetical protein